MPSPILNDEKTISKSESQADEFAGLFKYIQRNKKIPSFISEIKPDDDKVKKLLSEINRGNFYAKIFEDENSYLYLLYLIKEGKISFSSGMTVYMYLVALMQYGKIPVPAEDKQYKQNRFFSMYSMCEGGSATLIGSIYINEIIKNFKKINIDLDEKQIVQSFSSFPPVDQLLMLIPADSLEKNHSDNLSTILVANIPFLCWSTTLVNGYYIPSFAFINHLLSMISNHPIRMQPIFGSVGKNELMSLHRQNIHPVAMYAPQVKSRITTAHGWSCGPFPVMVHDLFHSFVGSLLNERDFIFDELIPQFNILIKSLENENDKQVISKIIEEAVDFDLAPIVNYKNTAKRFINYLKKCFYTGDENIPLFRKNRLSLGMNVEDKIYLWMSILGIDKNSKSSKIWQDLVVEIYIALSVANVDDEDFDVLELTAQQSKEFVQVSKDNINIDWNICLRIIRDKVSGKQLSANSTFRELDTQNGHQSLLYPQPAAILIKPRF